MKMTDGGQKTLAQKVLLAVRNPRLGWNYAATRLRGSFVRMRLQRRDGRVVIGRGFTLVSRMRISGPGRCLIGENVSIDGSMHTVTLPTYAPEAEISIGDNTFVNGARFGCARRIAIGRNCILGDCRIMDTNFHSIYPGRRDEAALIRVAAVEIGDDCWIGASAFILPGTRIGSGCTVAAGSVVMGRFPRNSVIAGNPAQVLMSVGNPPGTAAGPAAAVPIRS
jgi:acetyltransferase-like isoleucine patch superfamily enzyme